MSGPEHHFYVDNIHFENNVDCRCVINHFKDEAVFKDQLLTAEYVSPWVKLLSHFNLLNLGSQLNQDWFCNNQSPAGSWKKCLEFDSKSRKHANSHSAKHVKWYESVNSHAASVICSSETKMRPFIIIDFYFKYYEFTTLFFFCLFLRRKWSWLQLWGQDC